MGIRTLRPVLQYLPQNGGGQGKVAEVQGNLRQKAVASLAAGILRGAGFLPRRWRTALGAMLGDLVRLSMTRARKVVDANLAIAFPIMNLAQRHTLRRAHFRALGQAALELGPLWYWPLPRALGLIREVRGDDLLDAALAKGHGVILFTAHLGAWEAAVLYIGQRWPVTVLYMETGNPAVNARMVAGRGRSGVQLVPKGGGIRPLLHALQQGKVIGILPDQNVDPREGDYAPFFGRPACTTPLLGRLAARRAGAYFFPARSYRSVSILIGIVPAFRLILETTVNPPVLFRGFTDGGLQCDIHRRGIRLRIAARERFRHGHNLDTKTLTTR